MRRGQTSEAGGGVRASSARRPRARRAAAQGVDAIRRGLVTCVYDATRRDALQSARTQRSLATPHHCVGKLIQVYAKCE